MKPSFPMRAPRLLLRSGLSALALSTACTSQPPPKAPPPPGGEIDLTAHREPSPAPAWPAGLKPCSKDDPDGAGCAAGPKKAPSGAARSDESTVWNVPIGPDDPVRGAKDALVTLVVFSDFECPFCKHASSTFERLLADFPDDVRIAWKDLPLPMHPQAEPAAELAREARALKGDAGFWAAHDLLYEWQAALGDATYRQIAQRLGLSWAATRTALHSARHGAVIRADVALSDRVDVPATPTTFVNGRKLVGAQSYDKTRTLVEEELEKARKLEKAGTPRGELYARIISSGVQVQPPSDVPPSAPGE